ncbi:MAG: hypothetical protein Q4A90_08630 [Streptococcus sp.]|nr:hypothetical protein [Streptococcus sp.]
MAFTPQEFKIEYKAIEEFVSEAMKSYKHELDLTGIVVQIKEQLLQPTVVISAIVSKVLAQFRQCKFYYLFNSV